MCDCRTIALPRKAVMVYGCSLMTEMVPKGADSNHVVQTG
jgi:hypothetical protein